MQVVSFTNMCNLCNFGFLESNWANQISNPSIYNMIHWFAGTNDPATILMFKYYFFHNFLQILCKNSFNLLIYLSLLIHKSNAWNIRRLVNKPFIPANQRTSKPANQQTSKPANQCIVDCRIYNSPSHSRILNQK